MGQKHHRTGKVQCSPSGAAIYYSIRQASWAWAVKRVDFPLLQKLRCPEFCSMRLLAACVRIEARWIGS
jgi:hypothetical protein